MGGLIGYSEIRRVDYCHFAGKVKGEALYAGISGLTSLGDIIGNLVFLHETDDNAGVAEITNAAKYARFGNNSVLQRKSNEWYLSIGSETILLPAGETEKEFIREIISSNRLAESALSRLPSSFRVLNVPFGTKIPEDTPLSVDLGKKDYRPLFQHFIRGHFVIDDNLFKMSGNMRALARGVYIIPCFKEAEGTYEVVWVLLNVV